MGQTLDRLAGQRASGHQASGHLAQQRAPRHLARQWAPSHQARQWAVTQLARQRAPGHPPRYGLSGSTAGIGSPGIRSFGLPAGTASSGKAVGLTGHQALDRLARQRASGHQV
ncbi:unnamed protein product [Staurois parvus]|uniref:Uncharacterized protein n=1 Tax=Staurois parvus TaxID=386267 RepID=A0ABN9D3X4_9NEOB|nr:unnamed protein product [Staurois parvus]